uniref:Uncharacterized protein n=1 Tax=viral metagenome TaxID=1070528 RepID=A0A6C0CF73_9ZZZZ
MNNIDFCNKVVTIPQSGGTCWFTAILMSLLYSQHSRKLLYNHLEQFKDKDDLLKILNTILKYHYVNPEKAESFFSKYTSENILDYVQILDGVALDHRTSEIMKKQGAYPYIFLPKFIRRLNKTCLTLDYYNDVFYTGINEFLHHGIDPSGNLGLINYLDYGIDTPRFLFKIKGNLEYTLKNPDYICVNMWNNMKERGNKPYYVTLLDKGINTPAISEGLKLHNYNVKFEGLYEFKDEIIYNGEVYVLNSCILGNYNDMPTGHAIAGISCKNNRYVYNGWTYNTIDPAMVVERMVKNTLPCYLTKYEWNVNNPYEKFCLNPKACTVDRIDYTRRDLCFSFGKGLRVLLYVKKSSIKSVDDNISSLSVVKKPNEDIFYFKSSSKSLKDNFELSKKSDISLSYIKSPNTNLKPHIHDLYKTISEIKSPEIVVSDKSKSKKISSSSVKSVHKSLKKEDNKNRIKELLEINKKLLLENKKNRSQIKELKLKIKLL